MAGDDGGGGGGDDSDERCNANTDGGDVKI
jgi:hypothetical protein